ncbi:DUF4112 domain-containing protein [Sulfitobacter noctilucicola]|nr:DUF4112 domain-containing protein [Sulfitobacter noctilucicola]
METQNTPHPHAKDLDRLRRLANRMDNAVRLPIVGVRVGWDAVLGLVPGIGDALALAPSAYIIKESHRMGVPAPTLARMGMNSGIDLLIGSIPLVGDIFDIGWRSKTRNVDLLETHLNRVASKKKAASLRPSVSQ